MNSLSVGGDAVGRLPGPDGGSGRVVFVPYGAPGDQVRLTRLEPHGSYARGWIEEVLAPGPDRVEPRCPIFFRPGRDAPACGGCDWQHLSREAQGRAKADLLREALRRTGGIAKPPVEPTLSPPSGGEWRYRNKVLIPLRRAADGRWAGGFYARGSHTVVPLEDCPIQSAGAVAVFRYVRDWLAAHPPEAEALAPRHLLVRTASGGQILAALVAEGRSFPRGEEFAAGLQGAVPAVVSVYMNRNEGLGNAVLGPRWARLAGADRLEDRLAGLRFRLSPGTFFQVNHAMAERLYEQAAAMAEAGPSDRVWELYAGVGAMGQMLARTAAFVWAVEENPQAVRDGIDSLALNGIGNMRFRPGRCEVVLAGKPRDKEADPTLVVLDPPRAGCDRRVLKAVARRSPRRIVYVSCDPATLGRDARYLATAGYHLVRSVPVDLFPQTAHIESVSLFTRFAGPRGASAAPTPGAPKASL